MRKLIIAIMFSLSLTGCATQANHYGSFVENQPGLNQHAVVTDTVDQLSELYPPAHTRFDLKQSTPDAFGLSLVRILRNRGYAVSEWNPEAENGQDQQNKPQNETRANAASAKSGLPLRYVFDQFSGTNMYRVSLSIGSQTLTRPYALEKGELLPAGQWARKE